MKQLNIKVVKDFLVQLVFLPAQAVGVLVFGFFTVLAFLCGALDDSDFDEKFREDYLYPEMLRGAESDE